MGNWFDEYCVIQLVKSGFIFQIRVELFDHLRVLFNQIDKPMVRDGI